MHQSPLARDGHRVEYHRHGGSVEMYRNVVRQLERVRSLDGLTDARIAILVRDKNNLNQFQKFCEDNGVPGSRFVRDRKAAAQGQC